MLASLQFYPLYITRHGSIFNKLTIYKFQNKKEKTTMNNTELAIRNRIMLLQSRKEDNGRIIKKLERQLKNLTNGR